MNKFLFFAQNIENSNLELSKEIRRRVPKNKKIVELSSLQSNQTNAYNTKSLKHRVSKKKKTT